MVYILVNEKMKDFLTNLKKIPKAPILNRIKYEEKEMVEYE